LIPSVESSCFFPHQFDENEFVEPKASLGRRIDTNQEFHFGRVRRKDVSELGILRCGDVAYGLLATRPAETSEKQRTTSGLPVERFGPNDPTDPFSEMRFFTLFR
tara:strand:+ start:94 stop:408 length:315 start_codon:yes stop_codon:yes gene_type:complete